MHDTTFPCYISMLLLFMICHSLHFSNMVFIIQLNVDDLGEVQEALWEAQLEWYNIGLRLNMKSHELDRIGTEAGDDTGKKLTQMIKSRLKMTEPCTWRVIYEALKNPTVNMPHVAQELLQKKKIVMQTGKYNQCIVYNVVCIGSVIILFLLQIPQMSHHRMELVKLPRLKVNAR